MAGNFPPLAPRVGLRQNPAHDPYPFRPDETTLWVGVDAAPAFENSWVNYVSVWEEAGARRIGTMVYLFGLVRDGTEGAVIFTLPEGWRPAAQHIFAQESSTLGTIRIDVQADGSVLTFAGTYTWVSLSGIVFPIA
jgi:hypothetical protein